MNVKELIDQLKLCPSDWFVMCDGMEIETVEQDESLGMVELR